MSDHLTSNPSAKELRASAHWFRTREIKLRGYDGMSADICERAADEIERLERCLFQMQEAAKDLASKVKPASGFCEFSDDGNHECKECDIKWPGRPPEATGVLALVKKMRDEYRSFLDKGKGTWPGPDYVQDETWARWQGAWSALDSIASEAERIARVPHEPQPSEARGDDLAGWLEEMHDYARPIDQPKLMQAAALLRSSHEPLPAPCSECERLRAGLSLIATDEHRLMNITARMTAESILSGKPIGAPVTKEIGHE